MSSVLQIPQDGFEEDSSQDLILVTETRVAVPENTTLLHGHTLQAIVVVTTLALQVIPLHPEKQGGGETKDDNASTQIEIVENGVVGCILGQSSPGGDQATHVAHHGYSREGRGSGGVTGDVDRSPTGANYEKRRGGLSSSAMLSQLGNAPVHSQAPIGNDPDMMKKVAA